MLNTVIDFEVFDDFCKSQPKPIPEGSDEDNLCWNSFWRYLKSGSNITLTNYINQENIFLTQLTTGRQGSKCIVDERFKSPNKNTFPKKVNTRTVFFLHEPDLETQNAYKNNNGLFIAFKNDYKDAWKQLSLFMKESVLPVRDGENICFKSWEQLKDYLTPLSDLIIADNYLFDENIWDANLFEFLKYFNEVAPVKFNLMILTFIGRKYPIEIGTIYSRVNAKLKENDIHCNLCIILTTQTLKEHDRGIFTNYIRIKSGDSFNYFDSNGNFITKGTDIDFHTMVEADKCNAADAVLSNIKKIIKKLAGKIDKEKYIKGNTTNNLLNIN